MSILTAFSYHAAGWGASSPWLQEDPDLTYPQQKPETHQTPCSLSLDWKEQLSNP